MGEGGVEGWWGLRGGVRGGGGGGGLPMGQQHSN